jgi:acylpyruvate hydrolase
MKILCVGRNYAEHAKELSNAVPTKPMFFLKPDTALVRGNQDFYYPEFSKDIHYECEVVYHVCKEGKHVNPKFAKDYVDAVGLGIDFTARDLQQEAKEKGHPWTLAKMFNGSAPVSEFLPVSDFKDLADLHFELRLNGETRQQGHTADMIFPLETLISYITQFITIKKGDLIFTGTPAGVGPVKIGDRLEASLEGKSLLDFHVR